MGFDDLRGYALRANRSQTSPESQLCEHLVLHRLEGLVRRVLGTGVESTRVMGPSVPPNLTDRVDSVADQVDEVFDLARVRLRLSRLVEGPAVGP